MLHEIIIKLKRILPRRVKNKIKNKTGLGMTSQKVSTFARVETDSRKINVAVYMGGGLGDFIVYSAIIDQMLRMCDPNIYIFTLSYENAEKILGKRKNIEIHYPFRIPAKVFDVFFEITDFIHVREWEPIRLKYKSKIMYEAVYKIIRYNEVNIPKSDSMTSQRLLIITRAKHNNLNRWTQLSCGGVFDMDSMRAEISVADNSSVLIRYGLNVDHYITIHYGTDPDAGGKRQTKLWPYENYRKFVSLLKSKYSEINIVQLAANNETQIPGVDVCIRDADLEDVKVVLKYALTHVSGEGGIAHIATQVGVQCVVLFGPTPAHYYGYPTNINIVSSACKECVDISPDWFIRCPRGLEKSVCMSAISAETVLEAVEKVISYK